MIRVSVLYPSEAGATFDHAYYADKHVALVKQLLGPLGLVRVEVDRGLGGAAGSPAPFVAAGHLYFNSLGEWERAFEAHGAELVADIPNYTNLGPQIQISEITKTD